MKWRAIIAVAAWAMGGLGWMGRAEGAPLGVRPILTSRSERALGDDYSIRVWGRADGLPSDRVTCLAQTRDGYLWIGTPEGLARFDGIRFVRFDQTSTPQLADPRVLRIAEDATSNVWVATEDRRIQVFGPAGWELARFRGEPVTLNYHLHGGGDEGVWVDTTSGWFRGTTVEAAGPGMPASRLESVPQVPRDTLQVFEDAGDRLGLVHPGGWVVIGSGPAERYEFSRYAPREPNRTASVTARSAEGTRWFLHGEYGRPEPFRLYRWSGTTTELVDDRLPPPGNWPTFLAVDRDGNVWHVAGPGFLGRTSTERAVRYRLPGGRPNDVPLDAAVGLDGGLWIALDQGGLMQLRPREVHSMGPESGLGHPMVRALVPGPGGTLWVGTEEGVARVEAAGDSGPWSAAAAGLPGASVRALARDAGGALWAGTARGLFVEANGHWLARPLPKRASLPDGDGLGSTKVRDLLALREGGIWVATAHQVAVVPPDGASPWSLALLPSVGPMDLMEDRAGNAWLATEAAGVMVWNAESVRRASAAIPFRELTGYSDDRVRLPPDGWFRDGDGLGSDQAWEILEDRAGTVWIAGPRGLLRLPREAARAVVEGIAVPSGPGASPFLFTPRQGLPELAVNSLVEDEHGSLWLGSDRGVFRIPLEDFEAVATGRGRRLRAEVFGLVDGLPSEETNGRLSHPGAARDGRGRIWFATTRGLACFRPGPPSSPVAGPRVAIEEVRVNGRILATTLPQQPQGGSVGPGRRAGEDAAGEAARAVRRIAGPTTLTPGRGRVIEISFTGMEEAAPRDLRFRYRLEGYEEADHEIGDRRVAYFTNLDPGPYRFRVWAAGRAGTWSSNPAEFAFTIEPFVWQTWWFRVGTVAGVAGLGAAAAMRRIRQVRRMEALQRRAEQAELRTRLARDLHDGVGSGLARLAVLAHLPANREWPAGRVERQFRELSGAVRELAETVREISWNANPSPISLESLIAQIAQQTAEFLGSAGVRCRTSLPLEFPASQLTPEERSNLYYAAKEAVTNVVRHAAATEARFEVRLEEGWLRLVLWDNGQGFSVDGATLPTGGIPTTAEPARGGNGLPNLRARVAALGGRLILESAPDRGTTVCLEIPVDRLGSASSQGA